MKKFCVGAFSSFIIILSLYGITNPSYYLGLVLSFTEPYLFTRVILVLALMAYTFFPSLRFPLAQRIVKLSGFSLLAFGLACLYSADFFGNLGTNVLIGDIMLFIEGGILAMVLAFELPTVKSPTLQGPVYLSNLIASKPVAMSLGDKQLQTKLN